MGLEASELLKHASTHFQYTATHTATLALQYTYNTFVKVATHRSFTRCNTLH